ncbi:hypothetical protein B0T26DRAFT_274686 [Lasiosphaeria miniovina]|uniref:Uncharacterized protein n=1 Tax=Lasiosphaeria miniovina TaxID=1954250 RepID=A0AA40AJH9_9PEZI|nr:uncharacterized protein B0T26DRAFT_274686 [Lasiosphaeria miniovina]KAK0717016.1 hypothetical protein B0T26DRAFT_274686 [Lasiosphaeria miniovina]
MDGGVESEPATYLEHRSWLRYWECVQANAGEGKARQAVVGCGLGERGRGWSRQGAAAQLSGLARWSYQQAGTPHPLARFLLDSPPQWLDMVGWNGMAGWMPNRSVHEDLEKTGPGIRWQQNTIAPQPSHAGRPRRPLGCRNAEAKGSPAITEARSLRCCLNSSLGSQPLFARASEPVRQERRPRF